MKCGVVIFPGSNCDHDTVHILSSVYGMNTIELWHKETDLKGCDMVFIPGGFSYGDYLRSGAVARFSPIMNAVITFAEKGGLVMGICNGFQVLCEAHLLAGALMRNAGQKFVCKNVFIRTETSNTLLTRNVEKGTVLKIPIAHAEGNYFVDEKTLSSLQQNDQILFRYCNEAGEVNDTNNPNGSLDNIAGICNVGRNVFGMMPHPERAGEEALGNIDGAMLFSSLFNKVLNEIAG